MKTSAPSFRLSAGKLLFFFSFLTMAVFVLPVAAVQAQQAGATQRVLQGKVVDKADAPIRGAVVYLKDSHTLSVRSYITDDNGTYRFGQLAQNTDYEIWAESNGRKSGTKSISSFDSKKEFTFSLKIDTTK
jgi:Carboxypeptidase regulatory-like domain